MSDKKSSTQAYKREGKTHKVNLRVSMSELEMLNQISYKEDIPVAQVIRNALKHYVNEHKNDD